MKVDYFISLAIHEHTMTILESQVYSKRSSRSFMLLTFSLKTLPYRKTSKKTRMFTVGYAIYLGKMPQE